MYQSLPPMKTLRSFEAAARLSSISKAAIELCVTQGAVSKQIKILESALGIGLFERTSNGVSLTLEGQQYFIVVANALSELNEVSQQLKQHPVQQQLWLDVIPSMTHIWLIPRIRSFEQLYPHLKVNLISGDGIPEFNTTHVDIAIRCLKPSMAQGHMLELFEEKLLLVAAPSLLEKAPIQTLSDIFQHPLLIQNTRSHLWDNFMQQQGAVVKSNSHFGMGFQHFYMSLKAAEEGLGLALIPDFLAREALAQGKVVNPLSLSGLSEYRYYLFSPNYKSQLKKTHEFSQWLTDNLIAI